MKKLKVLLGNIKSWFMIKREAKLYGHTKVYPGQRLFEFNYVKGEIEFASMVGKKYSRDTIVQFEIKDNCNYVSAINIEGACKKLGLNVNIKRGKK